MQISPVIRIEQLLPALFACSYIRRNEDLSADLGTLYYRKAIILSNVLRCILSVELKDYRPFRRIMHEVIKKGINIRSLTLSVYLNVRTFIAYTSFYAVFIRKSVYRRAESHALNYPVYPCNDSMLHVKYLSKYKI